MLINCAVALINLPIEMNVFDKQGINFKHNNNFQNTIDHPYFAGKLKSLCRVISDKDGNPITGMSDEMLLRLFRNGFAHYDIEVNSDFETEKRERIIIEIVVCNADATFLISVDNLKKFALEIADYYLKALPEE